MPEKAMMQSSAPSAKCFSVETPPAAPALSGPGVASTAEDGARISSPLVRRPPSRRQEEIERRYAGLKGEYGRAAGRLWKTPLERIFTTLAALSSERMTLKDLADRLGCCVEQTRKYVTILKRCDWPIRMVRGDHGKVWWTCDMRLVRVDSEAADYEDRSLSEPINNISDERVGLLVTSLAILLQETESFDLQALGECLLRLNPQEQRDFLSLTRTSA